MLRTVSLRGIRSYTNLRVTSNGTIWAEVTPDGGSGRQSQPDDPYKFLNKVVRNEKRRDYMKQRRRAFQPALTRFQKKLTKVRDIRRGKIEAFIEDAYMLKEQGY